LVEVTLVVTVLLGSITVTVAGISADKEEGGEPRDLPPSHHERPEGDAFLPPFP
jgi:hypothetical protein